MSEKSEALRLADALRDSVETDGEWSQEQVVAAAAELRRLHAQRDALLEALRPFANVDLRTQGVHHRFSDHVLAARAAIKTVEGQ